MLERLEISQLALIEHAELDLATGFQVITGETGAGKSLLLGAIGAITGQSVNKDVIRGGSEEARVEAVFSAVQDLFAEDAEVLELIGDEDQLILAREIRANGRNICRVNARIVPLALLRRIGDVLADIHGQNDRQQIFRSEKHLGMLDRFGRETIKPLQVAYTRAYQAWQELARREKELLADPEERRLLMERLQYQINEIKVLALREGEDAELQKRRDLLSHQEKLELGLRQALVDLQGSEDDSGASYHVANAFSEVQKLSFYADLAEPLSQLTQSAELIREAITSLYTMLDRLETHPGELEEVDQRLDAITRLKRKYGGDISSVLQFLAGAEDRLQRIEEAAEIADQIQERKKQLSAVLETRGLALREARQQAALALSEMIVAELRELGMRDAVFQVRFSEFGVSGARAHGLESCEFMLSANRGESLKPLAQTASGGEASRIMLAIKVILAEADETPLLIFDEIDTGISGETTEVVGRKLKKLALSHQILCVTHQAQIAAAADAQFLIYKESDVERTRTFIRQLSSAEREAEIARLLSGRSEDASSLDLARKLLSRSE